VKIWIDAQISPEIAQWFILTHGIEAMTVKDLGLRNATDRNIFLAAREAKAVLLTKDRDLVDLVAQLGSPPQILWVTCGNTSNAKLKAILTQAWPSAATLLVAGEKIVEVCDTTALSVKKNGVG
jgi:predicted nuclease of predicted toxin-antitoxin system